MPNGISFSSSISTCSSSFGSLPSASPLRRDGLEPLLHVSATRQLGAPMRRHAVPYLHGAAAEGRGGSAPVAAAVATTA
jgi:hypothetical protein